MSDLSVPGLGGGTYDTKALVDASMKVARIPLDRMKAELDVSKKQKTVWQDIGTSLARVRDSAAELFSFQNPFLEKSATSSDEKALTATATRDAGDESRQVVVKRLATADRLLSRPVDRNYKVEAGKYAFRIGVKDVAFTFAGGAVADFVDAVNKRVGTDLKASILKDTKDSQVLLLESRITGAANKLEFRDKARDLAVAVGLIQPNDATSFTGDIKPGVVQPGSLSKDVAASKAVQIDSGELTVRSGGRARLPVSPSFAVGDNIILELEVKTTSVDHTPWSPPPAPPGPDLPAGEVVEFQGIEVRNAPSRMPVPSFAPPQPPQTVDDMTVLSIERAGKSIPLPEVPVSPQWRTLRVPLAGLTDAVDAVVLENRNTYRDLAVRSVRIYDTTSRGDTRPVNALNEAGDAELTVDGVSVTRDTNTVADLIPGVTLTLRAPSAAPVDLAVTPNTKLMKDKIVAFVGRYNQALTEVDVLTRRDEAVIADAFYATDADREKARQQLGLLFGDMTLSRLKNQLTTAAMNAYPTSAGQALSLLAQIGVSTNTAAPGSAGVDRTRLRGYLDIDEPKLDAVLRDRTKAVQQIFGSDTNGDLVVDSGVAFEVDRLLRGYVGRAGIIEQRSLTLDTQISQKNQQIDRENTRLADTEAELKRKYISMEGALNSLNQSSKSLSAFGQQTTGQ